MTSPLHPEPPRDRMLRVAGELFYEHGFQAVGIDLVIERAGVAKATLYRHFPTKDDLIAEVLTRANQGFWIWLDSVIDEAPTPRDALVAVFDAVASLAASPNCLGCMFQVTAAEFPNSTHPGHNVALAHKKAVRSRLLRLAKASDLDSPAELADALLMLMDGAFAASRMYGPRNHARNVGRAARRLIEAHSAAVVSASTR